MCGRSGPSDSDHASFSSRVEPAVPEDRFRRRAWMPARSGPCARSPSPPPSAQTFGRAPSHDPRCGRPGVFRTLLPSPAHPPHDQIAWAHSSFVSGPMQPKWIGPTRIAMRQGGGRAGVTVCGGAGERTSLAI